METGTNPGGPRGDSPMILGDLLYAAGSPVRVPEAEWVALVRSIAIGNNAALHELYVRAHRLVFLLIVRITASHETAEELTLQVFHDIWRRAARYEAASGTVLAWIMNQARARAIDRLRFERREPRRLPHSDDPLHVLPPPASLQERLAQRLAAETGGYLLAPPAPAWREPEWEEVANGILCKLMATDVKNQRVSMLVRLMPGIAYPAHTHAGVEELHLLEGELWINARKLHPGDYNRAEMHTSDTVVRSETGCTCFLMTSTQDVLG